MEFLENYRFYYHSAEPDSPGKQGGGRQAARPKTKFQIA
jgi:hypothetical protein